MPFGSTEFQNFCRSWNIKSITSSPFYPPANGLVDVSKRIMNKAIESNTDVEILLLEYRSTTVPSIEVSPAKAVMNRLLRTRIPIKDENLKPKIQTNLQNTLRKQ
ncbi:hypothetical protein QE152_g33366 [Popillia japonica]|uniref:Integrase catalytic domain-containing protein n=1 Tax=Popillia japonica TaxID=7064 RepID=A0AAW1IWX7_POPJA